MTLKAQSTKTLEAVLNSEEVGPLAAVREARAMSLAVCEEKLALFTLLLTCILQRHKTFQFSLSGVLNKCVNSFF
jgi:hypothetical protein